MNYSNTTSIIDTDTNVSSHIDALIKARIKMVIRYYTSDATSKKRLTQNEAAALVNAGIKIGVVYQDGDTELHDFNHERGFNAGKEAFNYASKTIQQPANSIISFSVDFNPTVDDIHHCIIPYFQGINEAFDHLKTADLHYRVGVYGSGAVCNMLFAKNLCDYRWLSMSRGFHGTEEAIKNGAYELMQLDDKGAKISAHPSDKPKHDDLPVDYNQINPLPSSAFEIKRSLPKPTGGGEYIVHVSEKHPLYLRKCADSQSPSIGILHNGTLVNVLNIEGKWAYLIAMVCGKALCGFAHAEYLEPLEEEA